MNHPLAPLALYPKRILVLVLIALWIGWSAGPSRSSCQDDAVGAKDLKNLQGIWIVTAAERDGNALDRIKGNKLIVKENQFTVVIKTADLKGDLTLDAAKSPRRIDMQHQEGMLRDKKWEGIYKLDGDKLTLCYTEADSGKDRPDEFATRDGTSRLLIVLERKK